MTMLEVFLLLLSAVLLLAIFKLREGVNEITVLDQKQLDSANAEIERLKDRSTLELTAHKLAMETAKRESDIRIHEANIQKKRAEESEEKLKAELERNKKLLSQKKSSEVRTGQIAEQLMPILQDFPYDRKKVRGIFNPIDAIIFEDNEIIFMEFKTGKAKLSQKQREIKKLVEAGKVRWEERRIEGE